MNRPGAPQNMIPIRSDDGRQSWMRQLGEEEYEEAFNLIELSAKAGDNIGIGEIPTLDYFRTMMQKSVAVGFYNDNKVLEDLIVLKPYHVVRHVNPALCQIILATRQRPTEDHLRHLIRMGCGLARREDCGGFKKFILEIFAYCLPYIQASSLEGFHATCVIPYAGLLAGHKGYTMSYIMYREIDAATANTDQICPLPHNLRIHRPIQISAASDFKPILLEGPDYLPLDYRCATGLEVRVRQLRLDELPNFYSIFAASMDQGYGVDEIPTYELFLQNRVKKFYNFVVEVKENQEVAYMNVGPSRSTRCQTQNILATSNLVILPEFRSKRLGRDMMRLSVLFVALCGYEHIVGTMAITNIPVVKSGNDEIFQIVGILPRAIYFSRTGWTDLLIINLKLPAVVDRGNKSFVTRAKL